MKPWNEITHYAAFDWAKGHHQIVMVDRQGQIVAEWEFDHSLEGWKQWRERTASYPALAVAIETNQGAAVDQLLQSGSTVYPINPRSAKAYRERKVASSNKLIGSMRGASPMPCAPMDTAGAHWRHWIHCCRNCGYCAATN